MTPERQQQIKQVFQAARELEPEARMAYLKEVCHDDDVLQQEVASLLLAYEGQEDFLRQPLPGAHSQQVELSAEHIVLQSGQQIGPYLVERHIRAGGMGVVYLARDTRLGRLVTIKLLPPRFTQNQERMRRFQQEARAASALNHPNLLTIYEVGQMEAEVGGSFYIVAEFVAGQTLRELFLDDTMQLGKALDLAIQLTDALSAAHRAGIVHRDIKPENVMLRPDGIVKVLDFGLAKLTEQAERSPDISFATVTTQPGLVMGTVAYMSPEQARGLDIDARSDLFSVGTVLYELLTGCKPFQGETPSDVLAALLEREPAPLTYYVSGLPAALPQIVARAMAKAPADRYQSASELGDALKHLKQELEFTAHLNRSGSEENPLTVKVGAVAQGNEITRLLVAAQGNRNVGPAVRPRWRRFGLGLVVLLMLAAGWWWQRSQPSSTALDSVAVLPFLNNANNAQMDYLPDTITENLIDNLTRLPGLRVRARNTVITYKGREVDPRQVGQELQVGAVIIGQVRWRGERLLLRVELVDTADGSRLWGDEFQYTRANLVNVQGEIAREIAAKLQHHLTPDDQRQLGKRYSTNSKAYELYSQGRYLYLQYRRESQEKALEYFRQAIVVDSHYALAYCGIADVYADFSGQYLLPRDAMSKAREAALKAIELDESLPEAHHSLALVKLWGDWDWAGAEREYKRALDLNPNFLPARIYYAELLMQQKRFEEALRQIRWAQEYDPVSLKAKEREASIYFHYRQYENALAAYQKILELDPNQPDTHIRLSLVFIALGMKQEAVVQALKAQTPTASPTHRAWMATVYARAGQPKEALKLLRELEAQAQHERISPSYFSRIHLGLGNKEQAFLWLQKVYEEQSDHLLFLGIDPIYDPVRNDPRFAELLRKIGLAP